MSTADPVEARLVATGAALACFAVMFGAFGAHWLKSWIEPEQLGWWQTGVQYQMWHALAVLGLGLSGLNLARLPAWILAGGTVVFSSTLYALALGGPHWIGVITPIGGAAMILGWGLLVWRSIR